MPLSSRSGTPLHAALRAGTLIACLASAACSPYTGSAGSLRPETVQKERGWLLVNDVPLLRQRSQHDCGVTALAMVISYLRPAFATETLLKHGEQPDRRVSARELRDRARELGFDAFVVEGTAEDLVHELQHGRPALVGVAKPTVQGAVAHYQVVVGMHAATQRIALLDPAEGWLQNTFTGFLREWQASGRVLIVVMPRGPTPFRAATPPQLGHFVPSRLPLRQDPGAKVRCRAAVASKSPQSGLTHSARLGRIQRKGPPP